MIKHKQPRVVAIGGGTGLPVLLRGLKKLPIDLTALVTVADDGGSTGRLVEDMHMPAPGDIRNVIAAMSAAEPMLIELFQHRFDVGDGLSGHSLGNLLLAAMTSITGDFNTGIKEISRVLNVEGEIYPISDQSMKLHAVMSDGTVVSGESKIPLQRQKIERVYLSPKPIRALPKAIEVIKKADLVVISPGSLYTSILPNLIVPNIANALRETSAPVVYVCNVMTQDGETTGYTAADHVQAITDHIGPGCLDSIIVHNKPIRKGPRAIYAEKDAEPVIYDMERLKGMGLNIIEDDIVEYHHSAVRHSTSKIARLIHSLL